MTATLAAPRPTTSRTRKRWTIDEVHELIALGKLPETGYELIEGDLITTMLKNMPHVVAVNKVLRWIYGAFGIEHTMSQDPVSISRYSNPEPDVCVLRQSVETYLPTGTPTIGEAVLVIEVSDSTLEYDLTTKADLYARAAVAEYWVLDVPGRRLLIHTAPQNGSYPAPRILAETDTATTLANAAAPIRVADLLP